MGLNFSCTIAWKGTTRHLLENAVDATFRLRETLRGNINPARKQHRIPIPKTA